MNKILFKDAGSSFLIVGFLFAILLCVMSFNLSGLKKEAQLALLILGILTLGSLLIKKPFAGRNIPFYILLGMMVCLVIYIITNSIVNLINPDDGWITLGKEKKKVMSVNWIWGILFGVILSPIVVLYYHKRVNRIFLLEISLTGIFVFITSIILIK